MYRGADDANRVFGEEIQKLPDHIQDNALNWHMSWAKTNNIPVHKHCEEQGLAGIIMCMNRQRGLDTNRFMSIWIKLISVMQIHLF